MLTRQLGTRGPRVSALGTLTVSLTAEELAHIETAVPISAAAGHRYPAQLMGNLDSEKS